MKGPACEQAFLLGGPWDIETTYIDPFKGGYRDIHIYIYTYIGFRDIWSFEFRV